jgi:hypothetical protein
VYLRSTVVLIWLLFGNDVRSVFGNDVRSVFGKCVT